MEMIRKLRRRLVSASMLSLLLVLFTIVSVASLLNYRELTADADRVLELLAENGGEFPQFLAEVPQEDISPQEFPTGEDLPPELPEGRTPDGRRGDGDPGRRLALGNVRGASL